MPHARQTTKSSEQKKTKPIARLNQESDIVDLLLEDHKPLKKLIKVMKSEDSTPEEKFDAFEEFAPLLIAHAKPEEQVLYAFMKQDDDLREEGFEGEVEHGLADQMVEEAKRTSDEDLQSARIKVLAELVEHHIKEEESTLLPDFKRHSNKEERREMGHEYLDAKIEFENINSVGAPSETETH